MFDGSSEGPLAGGAAVTMAVFRAMGTTTSVPAAAAASAPAASVQLRRRRLDPATARAAMAWPFTEREVSASRRSSVAIVVSSTFISRPPA
ncbi:hypothetical protein GCM10027612_08860 [Microbispora bryophytorum subsp. camponoti]